LLDDLNGPSKTTSVDGSAARFAEVMWVEDTGVPVAEVTMIVGVIVWRS
jgi:hypothetical protein